GPIKKISYMKTGIPIIDIFERNMVRRFDIAFDDDNSWILQNKRLAQDILAQIAHSCHNTFYEIRIITSTLYANGVSMETFPYKCKSKHILKQIVKRSGICSFGDHIECLSNLKYTFERSNSRTITDDIDTTLVLYFKTMSDAKDAQIQLEQRLKHDDMADQLPKEFHHCIIKLDDYASEDLPTMVSLRKKHG
ncbi:hypothetical protein RFI_11088, partial [Reticulomyxa filosa]